MTKQQTPGPDTLPALASLKQVANHLGVDEKSVRRWLAAGLLTGVRIGPRLIRIERDSVLALAKPVGGSR